MKQNQLHKKIMHRIYYAFALRAATHPLVVHSVILVISVFALSRLTHVSAIVNNIQSVRIGELDSYILNTLAHTEFITLLCFGIVFFTLLSIPLRLSWPKDRHMQTA